MIRPVAVALFFLTFSFSIAHSAPDERAQAPINVMPEVREAGRAPVLRSSGSSLNGLSARETAGPDTFSLYGGPDRPWEGRFEDPGDGSPSWNGWTSVDKTDLLAFWHISTFNAANLNGNGAANHAMWSGQDALQQPEWGSPPGYGNSWSDVLLYESAPLEDASISQTVALDFFFNYDTEPGYDFFIVEYDSAGVWVSVLEVEGSNKDESGIFAGPGVQYSTTGASPITFAGSDYGGMNGDRIRIRLRVESDWSFSDEDGLHDSHAGAVQVDDITLTTSSGTSFENFEGVEPFLFNPERNQFAGDFAEIFGAFIDIDPCRSNFTPMVGFIDYGQEPRNGPGPNGVASTGGATSPGIQYGIPGYYVTPYQGGLSLGEVPLDNDVLSPVIMWDLPGIDDDGGDIADAVLDFDVWFHLPYANGLVMRVGVRYAAAGQDFEPWTVYSWVSPVGHWERWRRFLDFMPPDIDRIQVSLGVRDFAAVFGVPGVAGTPAPMFDNIHVYKTSVGGAILWTEHQYLAPDGFPKSGEIDPATPSSRDLLDVPFDMARDVNSGNSVMAPGDSIVVSAWTVIPGTTIDDLRMHWALTKNSLFEDAIRVAPSRLKDVNVDITNPGVWTGEVLAMPCTDAAGDTLGYNVFFDLPDQDFRYPGDVLQYYLRSEDSDGRITTLPHDVSGFGVLNSAYPRWATVRALPSLRDTSGAHPSILVLSDVPAALRQEGLPATDSEAGHSLAHLGMAVGTEYDEYLRRAVGTGTAADGIGSAGAHGANAAQLSGYSTILYFAGQRTAGRFSDGSNVWWNNKSNDYAALESWHALEGTRNMVYFGDQLADELSATSAAGLTYLTATMGVWYENPDVVPYIGGVTTPVVSPVHPSFSTEFAAYFLCHESLRVGGSFVSHNHVTPGPDSFYGHQFVDPSTGTVFPGPAASVIHPSALPGVTGYDVFFPYSFIWIRDQIQRTPVGMSNRTILLGELLDLFNEPWSGGQIVSAPELATLNLDVIPNPFNARTVVRFDVGIGQKGEVKVFNVRGELVRVLHRGEYQSRDFLWDGTDDSGASVASGVYIISASADGSIKVKKTALVR